MHKFNTGIFKKKKHTVDDLLKFYHSPTSAQLNFLHEVCQQHMGHAPSGSFGHQIVPVQLQGVSHDVWKYIGDATRQPVHEFQRRMTMNHHLAKTGGSVISAIGQGRKLVKKANVLKVIRMGLPTVENLSGLSGNIFSLSRIPQLHFN